ncbi:hypothetical protein CYMTET_17493, partial [Cymbomonas tetramitiformis]
MRAAGVAAAPVGGEERNDVESSVTPADAEVLYEDLGEESVISPKDKPLSPGLYIVGTPIGNLEDITLRALRTLRQATFVLAEDTRHTSRLLNHYSIRTRLVRCHTHNEAARSTYVMNQMLSGAAVALVSDAGMPAVSDPGGILVQAAIDAGVQVIPVPGPCAAVAAVVGAGLPPDFTFFGFPPDRRSNRRKQFQKFVNHAPTMLFLEVYEATAKGLSADRCFNLAPHDLLSTLGDAIEGLGGDRRCCVAREITKVHEEFWRGTLAGALAEFSGRRVRGEITLLVEGASADIVSESAEWSEETLRSYMQDLHEQGVSPSAAAREVASETGIKKNKIYRLALEIKNGSGALFICAKQQRMREAQERANKAVEAQLKAEEDAREARDRVAAAEAALEVAEERARTAEAEKEKAHAQVDKLVGQVHNLEQEVQQLQSELSSANLEIKKLGDELESSQMKLKVTEEEKEKLSGDKASLSIRVDTLEKDSQSQLAKIEALENAQHEQEIDSQKALNQSSSLKGMLEEKDKEIARLQEIERLKAQLLEQSQAPPAAAVKASDVPKDDPEFLKKLFGQRGLWWAVSNNAELQDISEQACEYITNNYATEVVLTETAYDADKAPHKDSDEPDDLNTYDGNVFTVTYSTALENKVPVGDDLPRAENTGHYHAANQNTHIEGAFGGGGCATGLRR